MRRISRVFVSALALTFAVAACGGGSGEFKALGQGSKARGFGKARDALRVKSDPGTIKQIGQAWRTSNYDPEVLRLLVAIADQRDKGTVSKESLRLDYGDKPPTPEVLEQRYTLEQQRVYGRNYKKGPFWTDAVPFLVEALAKFAEDPQKKNFDENSVIASEAIILAKKAKATIEPDELIRVATLKGLLKEKRRAKAAAIVALGSFGDSPKAVDALIKILETPLDEKDKESDPRFVRAAAKALGETGAQKALGALLAGRFKIPDPGAQMGCQSALVALGAPAVPELFKVFRGQNADINNWLKTNTCSPDSPSRKYCLYPSTVVSGAASMLGFFPLTKEQRKELETALLSTAAPPAGPDDPKLSVLNALSVQGDPTSAAAMWEFYEKNKSAEGTAKFAALDMYSRVAADDSKVGQFAGAIKTVSKEGMLEGEEPAIVDVYMRVMGRLAKDKNTLAELAAAAKKNRELATSNTDKLKKRREAEFKALETKSAEGQASYQKCQETEEGKKAEKPKDEETYPACKALFQAWEKLDDEKTKKDEELKGEEGKSSLFAQRADFVEKALASVAVAVECGGKPECLVKWAKAKPDQLRTLLGKSVPGLDKRKQEELVALTQGAQERALLDIAKLGSNGAAVLDDLLKLVFDREGSELRVNSLHALRRVASLPCDKCVKELDRVIDAQESDSTLGAQTMVTRQYLYYFRAAGKGSVEK